MDNRIYEPDLGELLDDSTIQALMRSDGIERFQLERLAERVRRNRLATPTAQTSPPS